MQEASGNARPRVPLKPSVNTRKTHEPPRPPTKRAVAVRVPLRKPSDNTSSANEAFCNPATNAEASEVSKGRLIYHINKATGIRRLYIPATIVKDVLTIAHTIEGYIGFTRCYERIVGL